MKDVNEMKTITKEEAENLLVYANEIVTKEQFVTDLKKVYEAIADGKRVLDVYEVFEKTQTDEKGFPKLAIARADRKKIYLTRMGNFEYRYIKTDFRGWKRTSGKLDFSLPRNTFTNLVKAGDKRYSTKVPLIPVKHFPKDDLSKYYILWEVEDWQEEEILPTDPFLLKRLTKNLFVIIAEWDLTPLEKAVMKGL